ncbi:amidohydrolase [Citromicrobium sp. RCC1885]|uniref:amidohydrolase family protein n=1 Tax=unclassified Citromicrobium TaxID=2630544 RepID=UPI0006C900CA|nr:MULTISPECIES: amidohydrolase family protein [unclassified Citromicrobium]KPM22028.1 amidohydrolase [Citromicrobium sp. RCC1885]KPM24054.1 amidohydrolase [Citromicrobium sp. RCC1878]OAM07339.1 amidohydrolase [Citromicrobium sp. RCC1897]|tara:strand:- start:1285 stop:2685 length:1401 start_codon:yes stop_codon:yes gene_type:complete
MLRCLAFLAMIALATTPLAASPPAPAAAGETLVIENVTVIPMTKEGGVLPNRTVVIEGGRIVSIEDAADAGDPPDANRIDGTGKWLVPGFSDMHVHIGNERMLRLLARSPVPEDGAANMQDAFTPYIVNGVLQVFDLAAMPETVGQRIAIESGRVLGPHLAMATMIDSNDPVLPFGITHSAGSPAQGRQAVKDAAADGFEFVKAYGHLDLPTFTAIVEEARARNIRVVGHIPQRGEGITGSFFQPGYDLVVHAEEFAQQTRSPDVAAIPSYVEMARKNGTALVTTLTANDRIAQIARDPGSLASREDLYVLPPQFYDLSVNSNPYAAQSSEGYIAYTQSIVEFNGPLVRAFAQAGIPVLTGTDAGIPGVAPGFSLHDEFEALAQAGLDNRLILEGSTRLAAEFLGVEGDRGTVAVGKRADLVLLDADPLKDIANTRRIAAVIRDGRYLDREDLDALLADLIARNWK